MHARPSLGPVSALLDVYQQALLFHGICAVSRLGIPIATLADIGPVLRARIAASPAGSKRPTHRRPRPHQAGKPRPRTHFANAWFPEGSVVARLQAKVQVSGYARMV